MNWALGRVAFRAFAQEGWRCKEFNPKQITLFEKNVY